MVNNPNIILFEDLNRKVLEKNNNQSLIIQKDKVNFYFKLFLKSNSDSLIAFSNGAVDYNKKKPPVFMREKWQGDYDSHCIYIDDPTLHDDNLRVGWGFGEDSHYYLESISKIVIKISLLLDISSANTIYFGSSAGGFMSLMLATIHPETIAVVNNPQFTVKDQRYIDFVKLKYPDYNNEQIKENFGIRFSFYKLSETLNYFPKIYYIINRYSENDVNLQYNPFRIYIDSCKKLSSKVEFIHYHSPNGHSGLYSREQTAKLLNQLSKKWVSDNYLSKTLKSQNYTNKFLVKNTNSDVLSELNYDNKIYIPSEFFQPNYFSEIEYIFSAKHGILKLTLLSKYRFESARNILQYRILKNSILLATEDMSQFNRPNDINIFNLVEGDRITLQVKAFKNQSTESWASASILNVLKTEEYVSSILFPEKITFTSPMMKKSKP